MIESPIPQISLNDTLDMDFVKGAKRLMEQEGVQPKQTQKKQSPQPTGNSSGVNMNALATLIENTVRKVMDETKCHIHFPDSNRSSSAEKSNQVSIAGGVNEVERARELIRGLTPIIFQFDLPVQSNLLPHSDDSNVFIKTIQDR